MRFQVYTADCENINIVFNPEHITLIEPYMEEYTSVTFLNGESRIIDLSVKAFLKLYEIPIEK